MEIIALVVSVIAALTGLGSLWFTNQQWQKVKKKIGMISDAGKAVEILPVIKDGELIEKDGFIQHKDSKDLTKLFVERNGVHGIWNAKT